MSSLDAFSNIMRVSGGGGYNGRAGNTSRGMASNANDGNNQVASLMLMLASDVVAGVGLRSALRSFLLSHVPLVEFSTGLELNVRELEWPSGGQSLRRLSDRRNVTDNDVSSSSEPFIVEVRGLKNKGQTCFANSTLQALASLEPLHIYLESMNRKLLVDNINNGNGRRLDDDSISLALLQTIRYVNGHKTPSRILKRRNSLLSSLGSIFSSASASGELPRRVMNAVAKHHSQFRCSNGVGGIVTAGMLEQQDSHEFFSALMDVLSREENGNKGSEDRDGEGGGSDRPVDGAGLAFCDSRFRGDTAFEEVVGDVHSRKTDYARTTSDVDSHHEEEEKKIDEHNQSDAMLLEQTPKDELIKNIVARSKASNAALPSKVARNPFDGWSGSTIKCASCHHIRPIRSTPFLGLSLPIASIQSEYLDDFLAAEYGGFAAAESVSDVQCLSCAIQKKIMELEDEVILIDGAVSSVQRRNKAAVKTNNTNGSIRMEKYSMESHDDIAGLLQESKQIKHQIALLEALDPDADDDKLDGRDNDGKDLGEKVLEEMGIVTSLLPPIIPHRGDAYKASLVMRPPEALCIHIQRRHYDAMRDQMVKVMRHVHFEEILDMRPYCAYDANVPYKLMSVVEHVGNAFGGHYQTYRRVDPESNDWLLVSDERIVLQGWNDVRRCQAYMLFYVTCRSVEQGQD